LALEGINHQPVIGTETEDAASMCDGVWQASIAIVFTVPAGGVSWTGDSPFK
jgi:hypothetical protein